MQLLRTALTRAAAAAVDGAGRGARAHGARSGVVCAPRNDHPRTDAHLVEHGYARSENVQYAHDLPDPRY